MGTTFSDVIIKKVEKKSKKQRKRKSNEEGRDNVLKEEVNECEINGALNDVTDAARPETEVKEEKLKMEKVEEDANADYDDKGFQVVMNRKTEKKVKQGNNKIKGSETKNLEARSAIQQVPRVRVLGGTESENWSVEKEAKEGEFQAAPPPRINPWRMKAEREATDTVEEVMKETKSPTVEETLAPAKQVEAGVELQLVMELVDKVEGGTVAGEVKEEEGKINVKKNVVKVEVGVKENEVVSGAVGNKEEVEELGVAAACCWPRLGETEAAGGLGDVGRQVTRLGTQAFANLHVSGLLCHPLVFQSQPRTQILLHQHQRLQEERLQGSTAPRLPQHQGGQVRGEGGEFRPYEDCQGGYA